MALVQIELTQEQNCTLFGVPCGTVITMELENYLQGVVPAEIFENRSPMQTLMAQAICARTYALRFALNGANLDDTTATQAFNATLIGSTPRSSEAVQATAGMVLFYQGEVIECFYSSSNDGMTKGSEEVWGAPLPYYVSRPDPWDDAGRFVAAEEGITIPIGHGVGLSQIGAEFAGSIGVTYEGMFLFYYPGTYVGTIGDSLV